MQQITALLLSLILSAGFAAQNATLSPVRDGPGDPPDSRVADEFPTDESAPDAPAPPEGELPKLPDSGFRASIGFPRMPSPEEIKPAPAVLGDFPLPPSFLVYIDSDPYGEVEVSGAEAVVFLAELGLDHYPAAAPAVDLAPYFPRCEYIRIVDDDFNCIVLFKDQPQAVLAGSTYGDSDHYYDVPADLFNKAYTLTLNHAAAQGIALTYALPRGPLPATLSADMFGEYFGAEFCPADDYSVLYQPTDTETQAFLSAIPWQSFSFIRTERRGETDPPEGDSISLSGLWITITFSAESNEAIVYAEQYGADAYHYYLMPEGAYETLHTALRGLSLHPGKTNPGIG